MARLLPGPLSRLANLSLTAKLTAVNVLLVLCLGSVVAVSWHMLPAEATAGEDVLLLTRAQRANQNLDMLHDALHSDVLQALLVNQVPGITPAQVQRTSRENAGALRNELTALNKLPLSSELRQQVVEARLATLSYGALAERLVELALTDRAAAAAEMEAFHSTFENAKVALGRQTDELARASEASLAASRDAARLARERLAVAAAITVFVGWCCVALVAGSIRRSLTRLRDVAVAIADGQLDRRTPVPGRDEVGTLALAINQMADHLQQMIDRTRRDAEQGVFGTELVEALEMADSEPQAHSVVARAMGEVSAEHPMELLLADSSHANLERAAEHPRAGSPGCGVDAAFSCVAVRRGHAVQFADSDALNACPRLRGRPQGAVSASCVPVTFMGRALGVLHASGPLGRPLAPLQFQRLATLGAQAGARIGTVRAFERTQLQASTDSLTGLSNRRSLEARMRQLMLAERGFTLVMCDLDHFKRLNDTHGHPAGDDALRLFAEVVRSCSREGDLLARWGGEEFAFVLLDTSAEHALAWCERVRGRLAQALKEHSRPAFTASFGLSHAGEAPTLELLVQRADAALYRAKSMGRDRAVPAEPAAPGEPSAPRPDSEQRASVDVRMMALQD